MDSNYTLRNLGYNHTQIEVLKKIYLQPGITRKELSEQTGISGRSIIKFVSEFLENGIVINFETILKTGGRNATGLAINPDFLFVLAVDIGSYSTKIGVVNLHGKVIADDFIYTRNVSLQSLKEQLTLYLNKFGKERFAGIGIGITGLIDHSNKFIRFSPNIPLFNNIDIVKEFEQPFGLPVCLDTSARCLSLAEQKYGYGKDVKNQIFVSVGRSISAGIIINNRLFNGSNGVSGEIGHICCENKKLRCTCGNYDCLELYSTLPMIVGTTANAVFNFQGYSPTAKLVNDKEDFSWRHVIKGFELKDKIVTECIEKAGNRLGYVLSSLVNTLNPELLVFGGSVTELLPPVIDQAIKTINELSLITAIQNLTVKKSELGNKAAIIGSAIQVMNKFFGVE